MIGSAAQQFVADRSERRLQGLPLKSVIATDVLSVDEYSFRDVQARQLEVTYRLRDSDVYVRISEWDRLA